MRTPVERTPITTPRRAIPTQMPHVLQFDGVDDYVTAGADLTTGAMSISGCFYLKGWGGVGNGRIFDDGSIDFYVNETNKNMTFSSNGVTLANSQNNSIMLKKWYRFTVTRKTNGKVNFYIDGVLSGSADQDAGTITPATGDVIIGNNSPVFLSRAFSGTLLNIVVHNKAITSEEAEALYYNNIIPTEGLVANWNRISDDGTTLLDTSGNNNHGTITGATRAPTLFGVPQPRKAIVPYVGSVEFDGVDDYVGIPINLNELPESFSFSVDVLYSGYRDDYARIVNGGLGGSAGDFGFALSFTLPVGNDVRFSIRDVNDNRVDGVGMSLIVGQWNKITCVKDGVTVKSYLNGVLVGTETLSTADISRSEMITIGGSGIYSSFGGKIASTRLYYRALTDEEIAALYYTNTTPYDHTPECVLNLETLAGRVVDGVWTDTSPAGNHATLSGAALVEGVAPTIARTIV